MAELKLYKTVTKGLKIIGMSLPFVVAGVWMVNQESHNTGKYAIGLLSICFFGLGIMVGLFHTFDRRPQIVINENGIWDRTTNQGVIKWEQIIDAYPLDIFKGRFISIVTDDTFVFRKTTYRWAAKINESVGAQNLNLHLGQIDIDVNELSSLINTLSKADREERNVLIKSYKVK